MEVESVHGVDISSSLAEGYDGPNRGISCTMCVCLVFDLRDRFVCA